MAATNINRVVITGNLTRDPELRSTPGGTSVCSLRVAVNSRRKEGGPVGRQAELLRRHRLGRAGRELRPVPGKGRPVAVDGRLNWREWEAQDGGKRQSVDIIADSVQFLGSRDAPPAQRRRSSPTSRPTPPTSRRRRGGGGGADDDIPF